jgi:hypothetical protein
MNTLTHLSLRFGDWATSAVPTPSPSPSGFGAYKGDEDLISPGWIGFTITFLVALAVVLLIVDMTRRVQRTRYRAEVQAKLDAEEAGDSPEPEKP